MPWTHYNSINETFTGFNVKPFANKVYYGKAGLVITVMTSIILLLMLIPKTVAKRINLFVAAVLVAYAVRTYTIFTSSLFEGEVQRLTGIYLVLILPFVILMCCVFPYIKNNSKEKNSTSVTPSIEE